ncbi:Hsp70 family protein [Argonema antarcticum]|uniref:Hsp70 family protein n=1 Tax=Argonema antarcticum TaxID=2942763 RepID=UPI0020135ACD|nr:Hsp70 family protein [Argonema antarcticum]MCL1472855.1 Hsp70 family protein [Argonema antarcticum A004/B2]
MTKTTVNPSNNPGGGLYVQSPEGQQLVFPLKHTEVQAKIAGNLSRVEVTQTFENPFTEPLEAVYIFPLPDEAAVDDMEIKIGSRIIKGNIKKREEAKQIYEEAKRQGRTAGLLEQERDNIFTQSLANIKPGEEIDVTIRYTDSLKFEGGDYEFVFPMVVGPRFIPGTPIAINTSGGGTATAPMTLNSDTDEVPDASRLNAPVLPPGTRSGHDIGVTVEIDAGIPIQNVRSTSHQIRIEHINKNSDLPSPRGGGTEGGQIVRVKLGGEDTIPNKDLILRYQVAGDNTQATVLTQSDERGGHFAIYLIPALEYRTNEIVPKDVVFLMDTSGSQDGDPLRKSQELMRRFINGLNPDDTFTIIDFSDITTQLSAAPLPNTPQNRAKAIDYINQLQANGGTYLLNGIRAVLNYPAAPAGRLRSIVLLTDGYIGNDNEILAEVQRELKPGNRLYSFGVGSSVNRFLLDRIAEIGRGTSQVIRQDEPSQEVAEKFFRQINNPVLTNIEISWQGGMKSQEIYPSTAPDLFAEQPLVLFGRKRDRTAGKLHITGVAAGGKRYEKTFELNFESSGNPAIAQLWGRAKIKDLMNQMFGVETTSGVEAVTETALTYQLLSQYTAFVAVSDDVRVDPEGKSVSVQVPVEMPEGVSYRGIFGQVVASAPRQVTRSQAKARLGWFSSSPEEEENDEFLQLERMSFSPSYSTEVMKDILLLDVTPLSLGVETLGGAMTKIIPRNTTIPTKKSRVFSTTADNQTGVEIHVLLGEREMANDNKLLGKLRLDGIPRAPRGVPQIEVTFDIDVNGILTVTAQDLATGKNQFISISGATTLPQNEVEKMVKSAEINAVADQEWRDNIDRQNLTDFQAYQAASQLGELGSQVPDTDIVQVEGLIEYQFDRKLSARSPEVLDEYLPVDTNFAEVQDGDLDFDDDIIIADYEVIDSQLQVISVTGLDEAAINAIAKHLELVNLPSGFSGEIVFEFTVGKGRVGRIMLDEEASSLKEAQIIEMIKRSIVTWLPPQSATGTVRVTLRINS